MNTQPSGGTIWKLASNASTPIFVIVAALIPKIKGIPGAKRAVKLEHRRERGCLPKLAVSGPDRERRH
jgi:hypothetical protein